MIALAFWSFLQNIRMNCNEVEILSLIFCGIPNLLWHTKYSYSKHIPVETFGRAAFSCPRAQTPEYGSHMLSIVPCHLFYFYCGSFLWLHCYTIFCVFCRVFSMARMPWKHNKWCCSRHQSVIHHPFEVDQRFRSMDFISPYKGSNQKQ
jgi:hypothetical protein